MNYLIPFLLGIDSPLKKVVKNDMLSLIFYFMAKYGIKQVNKVSARHLRSDNHSES